MIHVATIIGAHGIKGEVKLRSFTSDPKAFASYGPLTATDGRVFEVTKFRTQINDFICVLTNIIDRNAAEALRGTELCVAREKLPGLKQGEIYLSDIQGKQAVAEGKNLGRIIGFQNFGAGELMELESGLLVPVSSIASVSDTVTLNLPEGYLSEE
ncbi:MAG: ribosome maturation factor RimM [Pseudomonadota bacterium]|nr:ribosome maturation factor RimM [Pseudomonadota bacterium]